MPFISVAEEITKNSFTGVENKFISKYMPVLDANAVKVYLYALYVFQSGLNSYTLTDFANCLNFSEEKTREYFEYLEEYEIISVISHNPFEIKILDLQNISGTPKKYKPEKYSDFTKAVQSIIKGRMISANEYMEYFYLLEEYSFEQNALIMIITYCVNLKGDKIRYQYIKKVAKNFAEEGVTSAERVEEKLSAYTASTPFLLKLFTAAGIKKQPDIDDDKLYKKWTQELGFEENAIIVAAKCFKAKSSEKLDDALVELFKNRKFDALEIENYCKNKNSVYSLTIDIAKSLGVYMSDSAPYMENYTNVWCDYGYSPDCLKTIAVFCFKNGKRDFGDMDEFVKSLYGKGIVTDSSVLDFVHTRENDDKLIKNLLSVCGLSRKVIPWDREMLAKWREWDFSDEMLNEAAKLSAGKSNPIAYMNGVLSAWKNAGINSVEKIENFPSAQKSLSRDDKNLRAQIEQHYSDLRHSAEEKAERALATAMSDEIYGSVKKELNELSIKLAFAELQNGGLADELSEKISNLEKKAEARLKILKINKADFTPSYACKLCNDTGYDEEGNPCVCLKKFISNLQ